MKNSRKPFIFLVFLLPVFGRCLPNLPVKQCLKPFSMPGDHQLKMNINRVLSNIIQKIKFSPKNYAFHIAGSDSDAIYGHAQCRGDIDQENCLACILEATRRIKKDCNSSPQVEIWYELCFLRYDSTHFLKKEVKGPVIGWSSNFPVTDSFEFIKTVNSVMAVATIKAKAAANRFGAMKSLNLKNNVVVYGMVQCTADLQPSQCNYCINTLMNGIRSKCGDGADSECSLFTPSCMLSYAIHNFLALPV